MFKMRWNILFVIIVFLLAIVAGTIVYHNLEGWRILDSVYFTVATVTTVGYGDFVPHTDTGKIFTIFFSFFGIATALYLFSMLGGLIFERHVEKKVEQIKIAVKKEHVEKLKKSKRRKK